MMVVAVKKVISVVAIDSCSTCEKEQLWMMITIRKGIFLKILKLLDLITGYENTMWVCIMLL